MAFKRQKHIITALLINSGNGVFPVFCPKPFTLIYKAGFGIERLDRQRERPAVPQKLGVFIFGVANGKLTQKRLLFTERRT